MPAKAGTGMTHVVQRFMCLSFAIFLFAHQAMVDTAQNALVPPTAAIRM